MDITNQKLMIELTEDEQL